MSLLLRSILQGLGWELGKTAAKEAVDELRTADPDPGDARPTKREADAALRKAEKAAKAAAKARAKEAARREREVDAELSELKKRVDHER